MPIYRRSKIVMLVMAGLLLALGLLAHQAGWPPFAQLQPPPGPAGELERHPLYAGYRFGGPGVLDFGVQPLFFPVSTVTEAMRRDQILARGMARLGLTVRFHPFLKGVDLNHFLTSGRLRGGVAGDMPAFSVASRGQVLVTSLVHQGYISLLAGRQMLIDELRGRTVGFAQGSAAQFALLRVLRLGGLDGGQVRMLPLDVTQMPTAVRDGRVAALAAWEPNSTALLAQFPELRVIHRSLYYGFMYFDEAWAREHQPAMREMLAAQMRAMYWMRASHQNLLTACGWAMKAGRALMPPDLDVALGEYAHLVERDLLAVLPLPLIPRQDLAPRGRIARDYGLYRELARHRPLPEWAAVSPSFDRDLALEVASAPQVYRLHEFDYADARP